MLLNALHGSGYSFLEGAAKYSARVGAAPEFSITRIQFTTPLPLQRGFQVAASIIKRLDVRLLLCACELRLPAPFTEATFEEFNRLFRFTPFTMFESSGSQPSGSALTGKSSSPS
jgi:hypothetical protein